MKSWLEKNRKQVLVHGSVLLAFVLYCVLLAEPFSNLLETAPGESRIQRVGLPSMVSANVVMNFDRFVVVYDRLEMEGWAFIAGEDTDGMTTYLVLSRGGRDYVFDVVPRERTDVVRAFRHLGLHLDYAGFLAVVPLRKLTDGEYRVGVYLDKGYRRALWFDEDKRVKKVGGTVEVVSRVSRMVDLTVPAEGGEMVFYIDAQDVSVVGGETLVEIRGWAFIEGENAGGSQIYVVLMADSGSYVFDTAVQLRPDVTRARGNGRNLDLAGFVARIPVGMTPPGEYRVGLCVVKGDRRVFRSTDRVVDTRQL